MVRTGYLEGRIRCVLDRNDVRSRQRQSLQASISQNGGLLRFMLLQQIAFGDDGGHIQLSFRSFSSLLPLLYHLVVIFRACHFFNFLTFPCASGSVVKISEGRLGESVVHI